MLGWFEISETEVQAPQFRQLVQVGWVRNARMSDRNPASVVEVFLRLFISALLLEIGYFARERLVGLQRRIIRRNPISHLWPLKVSEFQFNDFVIGQYGVADKVVLLGIAPFPVESQRLACFG